MKIRLIAMIKIMKIIIIKIIKQNNKLNNNNNELVNYKIIIISNHFIKIINMKNVKLINKMV